MRIKGHQVSWYRIPYVGARYIYRKVKYVYNDKCAIARIAGVLDKPRSCDGIIRVCFISQMPEVWDKQALVFEKMIADNRFEPVILCVPEYDFVEKKFVPEKNSAYEFMKAKYGPEFVIPYHTGGEAFPSDYDFIFYDRPYNIYLPDGLRSEKLSAVSRICLVNYCTEDWDKEEVFSYVDFAKDVYIWFASNKCEYEYYKKTHLDKCLVRKVMNIGYPAFEYYAQLGRKAQYRDNVTILWTPRWSYDTGIGESHFFEYIDQFINFAKQNSRFKLIIRPHPLMFENFISKGKLTIEDVNKLKRKCSEYDIEFDNNKIIRDTFEKCDLLISDYSSVLSLFMLTGKPIIYCDSEVPGNEVFGEVCTGFYKAKSFTEITEILGELINGEDELKNRRSDICKQYLSPAEGIVDRMLDILQEEMKTDRGAQ